MSSKIDEIINILTPLKQKYPKIEKFIAELNFLEYHFSNTYPSELEKFNCEMRKQDSIKFLIEKLENISNEHEKAKEDFENPLNLLNVLLSDSVSLSDSYKTQKDSLQKDSLQKDSLQKDSLNKFPLIAKNMGSGFVGSTLTGTLIGAALGGALLGFKAGAAISPYLAIASFIPVIGPIIAGGGIIGTMLAGTLIGATIGIIVAAAGSISTYGKLSDNKKIKDGILNTSMTFNQSNSPQLSPSLVSNSI